MVGHSRKLLDVLEGNCLLTGKGLEVAPYFDPCLLKSDYDVMYTDYIDNDEIARKAAENPGHCDAELPIVDFVWTPGAPLRSCAPKDIFFDYVVASHVMEHVPNPLGWINDLLSVLKPGGRVALFLPQRRYNFDCYRQETQFYQLVQWWIEQPSVPTPGQLLDFMLNGVNINFEGGQSWNESGQVDDPKPSYTDNDAIGTSGFVYTEQTYIDAHCTVWNGDTVAEIFRRIISNGILNVEVSVVEQEDVEFLIILKKIGEPERLPPPRMVGIREYLLPYLMIPEPVSEVAGAHPNEEVEVAAAKTTFYRKFMKSLK